MSIKIDSSLETLSELGEYLSDEVVEQTIDGQLTERGRACKEALMSAHVLIAKLNAVKGAKSAKEKQLQLCDLCD
jgi:hypothetical protein